MEAASPSGSTSTMRPHVLIIGAGPGGLVLAQGLKAKGVSFAIFERDTSPSSRDQGFAITLHWMTIPSLLKIVPETAGPIESLSVCHGTGLTDEAAYYDAFTRVATGRSGGGNDKSFVRANRPRLRTWLMNGIDVQWGKRFKSFKEREGGVEVTFHDGSKVEGDVLVGADGINSSLRDAIFGNAGLPRPILTPLPVIVIAGEVTLPRAQYLRQFAISRSMYMANGATFRFFVGLKDVSDDLESASYYWLFRFATTDAHDPNQWTTTASKRELLEYVRSRMAETHEDFQDLLRWQTEEGMLAPLAIRDLLPQELPAGRATTVGDAAHPMSNFRGEGANQAMLDGILLSEHLATFFGTRSSPPKSVSVALRGYETAMIPRASQSVLASREAAHSMGLSLLEHFRQPPLSTTTDESKARLPVEVKLAA